MLEFIIGLLIILIIGVITDKDVRTTIFGSAVMFLLAYGVGVIAVTVWELL